MNPDDPRGSAGDPREEPPHDEALRALYRQLPAEVPRPETDAAIREAARAAVAAGRIHVLPWWRNLRWQAPMALAATLALTLVIVREGEDRLAYTPPAAAGDETQAMAEAAPAETAPVWEARPEAVTPARAPEAASETGSVAMAPAAKQRAMAEKAADSSAHVEARDSAQPAPAPAAPPAAPEAAPAAGLQGIGSSQGMVGGGGARGTTGARPDDFVAGAASGAAPEAGADLAGLAETGIARAKTAAKEAPGERAVAKRERTAAAAPAAPAVAVVEPVPPADALRKPVVADAAEAVAPWPWGLEPALSSTAFCERLGVTGTKVIGDCRREATHDAATFTFVVADATAFRAALARQLRDAQWLQVTPAGDGDDWRRYDGARLTLGVQATGSITMTLSAP